MNRVSPEARQVLKRIFEAYAARPVPEEQTERLCPAALCRAEQQLALRELREAGIVTLRRKIWGEQLYQIVEQNLPMIRRALYPGIPVKAAVGTASIELEAGPGLPGELFRALVFIAREGLPLTAKGAVHKKNISRLAAQLSVQEEQIRVLLPRSDSAELPLPVMLMLDLLLCLGLINRGASAYTVDAEMLAGWLRLPEQEMSNILYGVVLSRYGNPEPTEQHFRYLISAPEFTPGVWFALPEILDWMLEMGLTAETTGSRLAIAARVWIGCLSGLGWCELGNTEEGVLIFRWTDGKPQLAEATSAEDDPRCLIVSAEPPEGTAPEEDDASTPSSLFIVQPDYEVLVPPECSYEVRWVLAGCAELLYSEDLWSFRLTRERFQSAAEQGLSPDWVIAWLGSHALGGLPSELSMSLAEWSKGIGRTGLSRVILLDCRSEADADDIAAHPRLAHCLTRIGPAHFIVQPESIEPVRKELGTARMAPPRLIAGLDEKTPQPWPLVPGDSMQAFAAYALPGPVKEYGLPAGGTSPELLPLIPLQAEEGLLSGLESVPQMWIKEWRQYHGSTAQKVMEQAMAWGIKVRLSLERQIVDFIPVRISRSPWEVQGCLLHHGSEAAEEVKLRAGDWQEMQLLLPILRRNSSSA
ncbi:helicase-associated domain-containing protein [Paenibacillus sp. HW567]|uniref:helicase-associated domain-containing protein n=1 Tax=Paenibacillus sp. HW567 TaxID=1034769 RepID=UPI00037A9FDD|nr:helicase-associated domain-containing protein [Paenibacillus sp. HW567]